MSGNRTVLIVEDDKGQREELAMFFCSEGYITFQAESVVEAENIIGKEVPDIMILDLNLEDGGDGFNILSLHEKHKDMVILVLSGELLGEKYSELMVLTNGACVALRKPITPRAVVTIINKQLARTQSVRSHFLTLHYGDVSIDLDTGVVRRDSETSTVLTPVLKKLINTLAVNYLDSPQDAVSVEKLVSSIWSREDYLYGRQGSTAKLRVAVSRLQKKLRDGGVSKPIIEQTDKGKGGYKLIEEVVLEAQR